MATAVQYSPPSHPYTTYRHHSTFSTSTASSSSYSIVPRTSTLQKHSSSYRTIGSGGGGGGAGMASYSSYSSSTTGGPGATVPARPGSSYEKEQTQHLHGKLHKRSISKETSISVPSPTIEEFFPPDPSHHKKGIIKPLSLLKKVSSTGGGSGKLDLGKSDGGSGGTYYYSSSPYIGGRNSATDLSSFVPTHRQQHKRTISGNSGGSNASSPNYLGRRYAPTPTQSYPNSLGGNSESGDDDEDDDGYSEQRFGRKRVVGGGQIGQLRIVTSSTGLPLALPPRIPISESAPISPVTPLGRTHTVDSLDAKKRNDSFDRRKESIDRKRKIVGGRNSSEEYVESMKKAREKFEEQERKKEEREEKKARKSISKEESRRRSISKDESRRPSNDGTVGSNPQGKSSRWFATRHSTPDLGTTNEKTIGIPYSGGNKNATTSLRNIPIRAAEEGRRSRSEKRGHVGGGASPRGFKNQWQGFVMWVQIGFVRMGRKL
ncbi:hypothetical protein TWF102_000600 [Orbilia oligospora]|uniref:Uncharacterized protein n=1 Tax=Orbilia oligospora TaxID=2813651 RepID=A0A7C8J1S9_ORBOL|nr:hypothetical protein TWF102_000600 [Orbilia oligospora]KAF3084653.1 hypothetical protein TWF103_002364 [Orbilia oligospora]KAF3135668.1 hypothetical protein TWF594_008387 [Orbilia oligospora]